MTDAPAQVSLQLDGRPVRAAAGDYLLAVAREAGVSIPTLCHHPDLEPVGACRLCMVEVTHPDWGGWSGLMAACLYPAAEGLVVSTGSPRVLQARRRLLALLAARCPDAEVIQQLARDHGASTERLGIEPGQDSCVLCGLCARVCQAYATSALATQGRGADKQVGSFPGGPDECVGCGACAMICPTGHARRTERRTATTYQLWGREFEVPWCEVSPGRCQGCGACEEACPFAVPRVRLTRGAGQAALIPRHHCRGCGACVGACPAGAITQRGYSLAQLLELLPGRPGEESR